ncbi:MAG TPA: transposase [Candidatus Cybelea sp.]|nr:transposase [Candidatus Cybelea sp.]
MLAVVKRIERIRLYPTTRQAAALAVMLDVTRELYNALLQQRRDAYRLRKVTVTAKMQYTEITALRAEDRRLRAVYREAEDAVLHRLDLAMSAFFRHCKRGEAPGYPRFKSWQRWQQLEFPHGDRALRLDGVQQRVSIPDVGAVKLRKGRKVPAAYGRAWVVRKNNRWYSCFECERAVRPLPASNEMIGVDRGVHVLAALSDGRLIANPAVGEQRRAATARLQRELEAMTVRDRARRVINGREHRRVKARERLARAREREANARRDYARKVARRLVDGADVIALEKLSLRAMTRSAKGSVQCPGRNVRAKAGLNRVVLDSGFGLLRQMIVAKAEEAARTVVEVDCRFSSRECSHCGHIARESRRGRRFCCVRCGYRNHADVNAALVIRGRAQLARKSELDPAEEAGRRGKDAAAEAHTTKNRGFATASHNATATRYRSRCASIARGHVSKRPKASPSAPVALLLKYSSR